MSSLHRFPDVFAEWVPPAVAPAAPIVRTPATFVRELLRLRMIPPEFLVKILADAEHMSTIQMVDMLLARGIGTDVQLYDVLAAHWQMDHVNPFDCHRDPHLLAAMGAPHALHARVLPLRRIGPALMVAVADPDDIPRLRALTAHDGPIIPRLCSAARIEQAVLAQLGRAMAHTAETRVPLAESCRNWGTLLQAVMLGALVCLLAIGLLVTPTIVAGIFTLWAILTLIATSALKCATLIAATRPAAPENPATRIAHMPIVSIIVALYAEARIAPRLVRQLGQLDYPKDKLDVILAVEVDDHITRTALAQAGLPQWMRIVLVPRGALKTKPRALNYALGHCRGSIIGIYDAEDRPAPDQITRVVKQFYQRGPQVACLQGILDYFNPQTNWMARCFTVEYAGWFRVMLPGLQRLGLPIPLGGTTLFFRRAALEELGAWDAHNVTEDADLGMRLVRHGYRTELVATVTMEEANCRPIAWVKQRSRWIKGYMMTYVVHMRDPALLIAQIGWWRFAGFQVLFLGSLSQAVLVPVLWSFWLKVFGLPHPVADALPAWAMWGLMGVFVLAEGITLAMGLIGLSRTRHRVSRWWVPTLHLYYPLAAIASYKALWEMVTKPFYWDKTSHGHFD
jgi:glycosyltransferase XagB